MHAKLGKMLLVTVDTRMLQRDFPVSHALLAHDGLMTHRLQHLFGPVHAVQTGLERQNNTVTRSSTLYQTASNAPLLQATLVIAVGNLPDGLLEELFSGNRLFGGLLSDLGIAVRMTNRVIYRTTHPDGSSAASWGRKQRMLRAEDGLLLSDVDETLADEPTLRRLLVLPLDEIR